MQFACLYDSVHALSYHLSPIALLAALGAVIGPRVLTVAPPRRVHDVGAH